MGAYENAAAEEGSKDELRREFLRARGEITRLQAELEAAKRETAVAVELGIERAIGLLRAAKAEGYSVDGRVIDLMCALKSNHESKDTQGGE